MLALGTARGAAKHVPRRLSPTFPLRTADPFPKPSTQPSFREGTLAVGRGLGLVQGDTLPGAGSPGQGCSPALTADCPTLPGHTAWGPALIPSPLRVPLSSPVCPFGGGVEVGGWEARVVDRVWRKLGPPLPGKCLPPAQAWPGRLPDVSLQEEKPCIGCCTGVAWLPRAAILLPGGSSIRHLSKPIDFPAGPAPGEWSACGAGTLPVQAEAKAL